MLVLSSVQGNKYRSALSEMTGCKTFPQFFVDGKFLGGAVDACTMWKKGDLQKAFADAGVTGGGGNFNGYEGDPFEFLPKWMTKNPLRSIATFSGGKAPHPVYIRQNVLLFCEEKKYIRT